MIEDNQLEDISKKLERTREAGVELRDALTGLRNRLVHEGVEGTDNLGTKSDELLQAVRSMLGTSEVLARMIASRLIRESNLSIALPQFDNLRKAYGRQVQAFEDLWRDTIPIQVRAVLQKQGISDDAAWEERWGFAALKARSVLSEIRARDPRETDLLLTLRYARYPGPHYTPYAFIANIFGVSSPLIFHRVSDAEVAIVSEFLNQIASHAGLFSEVSVIMRRVPRFAGKLPRNTSVLRLRLVEQTIDVAIRIASERTQILDEAERDLEGPREIGHFKADLAAVYYIGRDEFRFMPFAEASRLQYDDIYGMGTDSLLEAIKSVSE